MMISIVPSVLNRRFKKGEHRGERPSCLEALIGAGGTFRAVEAGRMNRRPSPVRRHLDEGSTGQKNPGRTRSTSCRIANSTDGVRAPRLCERHSEIDSALSRPLSLTRLTPLRVSHPHHRLRQNLIPRIPSSPAARSSR